MYKQQHIRLLFRGAARFPDFSRKVGPTSKKLISFWGMRSCTSLPIPISNPCIHPLISFPSSHSLDESSLDEPLLDNELMAGSDIGKQSKVMGGTLVGPKPYRINSIFIYHQSDDMHYVIHSNPFWARSATLASANIGDSLPNWKRLSCHHTRLLFLLQKVDREKSECNRATFEVWIRNSRGSASYAEKVARLHASKFGNVQGKCFHICWSFCCSRSNTLLCPEGSFLAPKIGILFGDAVGALFEAPGCHLAVAMSSVTLLYKGGPHSVSKIHINLRCKKRIQKLVSWTFLSWSWQPVPFYYVDARGRVLQKPAIEALWGSARLGEAWARPRLERKTYWHKDKARLMGTRNYIILLLKSQEGWTWSSWCLCCLARILSRSWRKGTAWRQASKPQGYGNYDKEGTRFWTSKRKKKQARKNGPPQFKIPAAAVAGQISFNLK